MLQGARTYNETVALAYLSSHHEVALIADYFGVHYTTISRLVKAFEGHD